MGRRRRCTAALLAAVCAATTACTGSSSDSDPDEQTPAAVVARAEERSRADNTVFSIEGAGSDPEDGLTAEGAYLAASPPALRMTYTGTDPTDTVPGRWDHLVAGGQVYGRLLGVDVDEFDQPWEALVPPWNRSPLSAPADEGEYLLTFGAPADLDPRVFAYTLAAAADLVVDATEDVDGVRTTRYAAEVTADRLRAALGVDEDVRKLWLGRGVDSERIQLWIDGDDRLRKFVVAGVEAGLPQTLTVHLRALGEALTIEAPPAGDLRPLPLAAAGPTEFEELLRARLERRYGASCSADLADRYRRGEGPPPAHLTDVCTG